MLVFGETISTKYLLPVCNLYYRVIFGSTKISKHTISDQKFSKQHFLKEYGCFYFWSPDEVGIPLGFMSVPTSAV